MLRNSVNELWMLSICVAITAYILMATLLLTFDPEITKSVKAGVLATYFAVSLVLVYNYMQALKTFRFYEKILEEGLASGSFSNFKYKELYPLRTLLDKSRVRRFSCPITSIEHRFFQYNWEHVPVNELLRGYLYQLKSETRIATLNKPIGTSCKGFHEIPAILHKCVKDLDSVIQHVKSLNLDYTRNLDGTSVLNQNSETLTKGKLENQIEEEEKDIQHKLENTKCTNETSSTIKSFSMKTWEPVNDLNGVIQHVKSPNLDYTRNLEDTSVLNQNSETMAKEKLENHISEEEKDIQHKLESTRCAKETFCTIKSPRMKTWTPVKNFYSVIHHVKSLNVDYTRNMEDTSVLNQNTKTVTKKENQIAEEEGDIQHQLESTECTKKTSCIIKNPSMKTWTPVKDLDNVIQHVKSPNLDYIRNLEDSFVLNQNSETLIKNGNQENQTAEEEEDIQHQLESTECMKETSCTIKSPSTKTWAPVKDLDSVIQHAKSPNLDYTRYMEDTLVLNKNSETVIKKGNLENQIADEDIQHKLESTECAKEISCIIINPRVKTWTQVKDLDSVTQHVKPLNLDYTRNLEDTSAPNQNTKTVTKKENQIAEEEGDIEHESTECTKETSCTIKSPSMKTWTPVNNLHSVIQHVKSPNLDYTRNLGDTSVLNKNSETVTKKENLENQIAEEKGDIHHKLESTKCKKEISCTVKSTRIPPQARHRNLGKKEKVTERIFQTHIYAHCLWTSLLKYNGTYVSLTTATKFIHKAIGFIVESSVSFLMKIPLNKQEFSTVKHTSNLYPEKVMFIFYKTIAPIRHNAKALISFNKHVPNIPMKPYKWKVSVTPYMREISRKRYIYMISERESEIRKNKSTITKDTHRNSEVFPSLLTKGHGISVDEMLLSFQRFLPAVMTDPSITENEILIPKFEEADLKNFFALLIDLEESYYEIHSQPQKQMSVEDHDFELGNVVERN